MYRITDSYGTKLTTWKWSEALQWLEACSPSAWIHNRFTGRLLAARFQ